MSDETAREPRSLTAKLKAVFARNKAEVQKSSESPRPPAEASGGAPAEPPERPGSVIDQFFSQPWVVAYNLLGDRVERFLGPFEDLKPSLNRSLLRISFRAYVSLMFFFSGAMFLGSFAVTTLVGIVFRSNLTILIILATAIGILSSSLTFVALYVYPSTRADSRKRSLEEDLPYVVSHMAVLATAGIQPEKIFRSLAGSEQKEVITEDAKVIVRDVDLLGRDLISAMEAARDRTSSKSFADFLEGLIATTRSGGDLTKYFLSTARGVMETRRIAARQFIDTLGTLAEVYVGGLVVFPLIVIVMFSVMGFVSGSLGGFSVTTMMFLLTYVLIPMLGLLVLIMLDAIIPRW